MGNQAKCPDCMSSVKYDELASAKEIAETLRENGPNSAYSILAGISKENGLTKEQEDTLAMLSMEMYKCERADQALDEYDFGDYEVVGQEALWDTSNPQDYIKVLYVAGQDEEDSIRVSFHVRFNVAGEISECYALDMDSGDELGYLPFQSLK